MGLFDDIGDLIFGDDPQDTFGRQQRYIDQARREFQQGDIAALSRLGEGTRAAVGGYEAGERKASKVSRGARREAKERASELEGLALSRYGAGGRYGTTALDHARMGISSRLTRDLEGIDAAMAGLFSDLAVGKGRAQQQGQAAMAGLESQMGGRQAALSQQLAGLVPHEEGVFGDILGTAAGIGLASI